MRTIQEMTTLRGRRALVTGGSGHIGLAAVETLTELGAEVVILDRCPAEHQPPGCRFLECDLAHEQATRQAAAKTLDLLGGLEILVHCAGFVGTSQVPGWAGSLTEQTVAAWDASWRVNVTSAFILAQALHRPLSASGRGSITLVGSIYSVVGLVPGLYQGTGMQNPMGYGASKGAMLQLMRYLAATLAPAVRVNTVSPGGVLRQQPREFQQRYLQRTPLGRMATEEDLKGAFAYLCSDLSAYVTGHNLMVDGGWTVW